MKAGWAHFVGIGGIGMSALARLLLARGWKVTGSDWRPSRLTEELVHEGIVVYAGHAASQVGDATLVVATSAVPADNPEVVEARSRGILVLKRAALLGQLMAPYHAIAIAGTHGKTTTTALVGHVLASAGKDPTVMVGGESPDLGGNLRCGQGPYFVSEADEYDASFLQLEPDIAVVTNIEAEHLDFYGDYPSVLRAFGEFGSRLRAGGHLVVCADDPGVQQCFLAAGSPHRERCVTYGFVDGAEWRVGGIQTHGRGQTFWLWHRGHDWGSVRTNLPGRHNVANATAAVAVADLLGLETETIRQAVGSFRGTRRRFDVRGEARGVTWLDDYAHHPTEIRATLRAAREVYGERRLVCLFQPHTYSRTKFLLQDFATAFEDASQVVVCDIYAAREKDVWDVSSQDLAAAIQRPPARYIGDLTEAAMTLAQELAPRDVLVTMGAGDVDLAGPIVMDALRQR